MGIRNFLRMFAGFVSAGFGAMILLGSALQWQDGKVQGGMDITMMIFFGLLPLLVGVWIFYEGYQGSRRSRGENMERRILKLAKERGGVLTPQLLAVATSLSLAEAKAALDDLHQQGFCQIDLESDGDLVYRFAGLNTDSDAPDA